MNFLKYLQVGEAALPLIEEVFKEAEPLVEKLIDDAKALAGQTETLFDEAKAEFESVKESGIAGTAAGNAASSLVADVTTAYANAIQLVGKDADQVQSLILAATSQLKLLGAQLAGGNDVTAQPK